MNFWHEANSQAIRIYFAYNVAATNPLENRSCACLEVK